MWVLGGCIRKLSQDKWMRMKEKRILRCESFEPCRI